MKHLIEDPYYSTSSLALEDDLAAFLDEVYGDRTPSEFVPEIDAQPVPGRRLA